MKIIDINTASPYKVLTGRGLLSALPELFRKYLPDIGNKLFIISDSNVAPLYSRKVSSILREAGYAVSEYTVPAGEEAKSFKWYERIMKFLATEEAGRNDTIIALGGGVTGDLSGFSASTFSRGMNLVQIPTTLLSAVDSSVGGKTAINLPEGKNLVGTFYQPSLVIMDTDTFDTLDEKIFNDGCSEVIKYALLQDPDLFEMLEKTPLSKESDPEYMEKIIARCISIKRDIVIADTEDKGIRAKLNLGHTVGHAIEKESDYTISHGSAVASGMYMITSACCKKGICEEGTDIRLLSLLKAHGQNCCCPFSGHRLADSMRFDKKRNGNTINFILPLKIGECEIKKIKLDEIKDFLFKDEC